MIKYPKWGGKEDASNPSGLSEDQLGIHHITHSETYRKIRKGGQVIGLGETAPTKPDI